MFTIHMLDAAHGDCLWVEYGDPQRPKRLLIDTGPAATYAGPLQRRIQETVDREGRCVFELFVVTHIDDDHIGGALRFLDELDPDVVKIREIWFNGYFHLSDLPPADLGAMQAEKLTELIRRGGWPWNKRFQQRAAMVPRSGPLKSFRVGGMKLTLLSPTFEKLQALKPTWEQEIRRHGLVPGAAFADEETVLPGGFLGGALEDLAALPFKEDKTHPNGASIAFLAEFEGVRVLFAADAHPSVLVDSLQRPPFRGAPQAVDAFKLSHHGSAKNTSDPVLAAFPARHYLVSSTGARFGHPDDPTLARVVLGAAGRSPTLHFNVESDHNRDWGQAGRQQAHDYTARFGTAGEGLLVRLA